jgi:hypothetical protein
VFGDHQPICFESQQWTDEQIGQPQEKAKQQREIDESTQPRTPTANVVWQTIDTVLLAQAMNQ